MKSFLFSISASITFFYLVPSLSIAQEQQNDVINVRNVFPGRRIGGGTRAECASRLLVHLVPESSVYSPDNLGLIAILKGPTKNQKDATTKFISYDLVGERYELGNEIEKRTIPAEGASVHLIKSPFVRDSIVWESSFNCHDSKEGQTGFLGFDFVKVDSPPALSLLVEESLSIDKSFALNINWLSKFCSTNISTSHLVDRFELNDLNTKDWPSTLPVNCNY
tara:strand:+ start:668 stop:1333 length:666 start_codon:yes stop_codon:yes gene_type:complete